MSSPGVGGGGNFNQELEKILNEVGDVGDVDEAEAEAFAATLAAKGGLSNINVKRDSRRASSRKPPKVSSSMAPTTSSASVSPSSSVSQTAPSSTPSSSSSSSSSYVPSSSAMSNQANGSDKSSSHSSVRLNISKFEQAKPSTTLEAPQMRIRTSSLPEKPRFPLPSAIATNRDRAASDNPPSDQSSTNSRVSTRVQNINNNTANRFAHLYNSDVASTNNNNSSANTPSANVNMNSSSNSSSSYISGNTTSSNASSNSNNAGIARKQLVRRGVPGGTPPLQKKSSAGALPPTIQISDADSDPEIDKSPRLERRDKDSLISEYQPTTKTTTATMSRQPYDSDSLIQSPKSRKQIHDSDEDSDSELDSDFDEEDCGAMLRRQIQQQISRPTKVRIDKDQLANLFNTGGLTNSLPDLPDASQTQLLSPALTKKPRRRSTSTKTADEMAREVAVANSKIAEGEQTPYTDPPLMKSNRPTKSNESTFRRRAATIDKKLVTEVLSNTDEDEIESKLDELEEKVVKQRRDTFKGRPAIAPMPVDYGLVSDRFNTKKVTPITLIQNEGGRAGRGTIFFSSEIEETPQPVDYLYYQNEIERQIDIMAMEQAQMEEQEQVEEVIELPSQLEKMALVEQEKDDTQLAEDGSEILFTIPHCKLYVIENGLKEFVEEGPLFVLWLNEEFVTKAMATDQTYLLKSKDALEEEAKRSTYDGRLVIRVGNIIVSFLQFTRPTLCAKPFKYCFMLLNTFFLVKLPNKPPYMAKRETRLAFEYYLENYSAFIKLDDYGHVIENPSKTKMEFYVQPDGTLKYTRPRNVAKPPPQAVLIDKFALKIEEAGLEVSKGIVATAHFIGSGIAAANRTFKKHTKPCKKPVKVNPTVAKGLLKTQVIAEQRILKGAEKIGGTIEKFSMLAGSKMVGAAKWAIQGQPNPAKEAEAKQKKAIEMQEKLARGEQIEAENPTLDATHHLASCSVDALVSVLRSVEDALEIIVLEIRDSTVDGLTYRYGDEVGGAAYNAMDAAAKTTFAAYKVYAATSEVYLAKNIGLGVICGIAEGLSKELGGEPWKVGFIKLQGLLIEGWVDRLFILRTKSLSWIIPDDKSNPDEPNGYISLNDIQKVEVIPPDRAHKPNMFLIRMRKMARFYLCCSTQTEMHAWINAILSVKSFYDLSYKYAFGTPKARIAAQKGNQLTYH